MPLVDVAEQLRIAPAPARETVQVIVHAAGGRSVGFVVGDILDVVEQSVAVKNNGSHPGTFGSAVIQQKVTELVDLEHIAISAGLAQSGARTMQLGA